MRTKAWLLRSSCALGVALGSVGTSLLAATTAGRSDVRPGAASTGLSADSRLVAPPPYPRSGVELLGHLALADFTLLHPINANDVWGYVSPSGREYAILGLQPGTAFVEVTDPVLPVIVAQIPDANSLWSDMKTYGHYAYNSTEGSGGIQIFDLAQIDSGIVTLVGALTQSGLARSHTLALNEDSGYLYLCGSNLSPTGLYAVDLADPANPALVPGGRWTGSYVHAALVVSYDSGPYAGQEIAFIFGGVNGLYIVDVTTKTAMTTLAHLEYETLGYCHQGWLSEDRQYVFINDEFDERQGQVPRTTTYMVDVSDLANPTVADTFSTYFRSVDHNLMVTGSHVFEANYTTGLQIFDISDTQQVKHVGYFDTFLANNDATYDGAWGVYSALPSGNILISDIQSGLFVLDPTEALARLCGLPQPAVAEAGGVVKNRYLAFSPPPVSNTLAIRVKFAALPAPFAAFSQQERWVQAPFTVSLPFGGTLKLATLGCTPEFRDWGADGLIRILGAEIVPGATYEISVIEPSCPAGGNPVFSIPLPVVTSQLWGDITSFGVGGNPDGAVDFLDISAAIDGFQFLPGALPPDRTDLVPEIPNQAVNFLDISAVVSGFQGESYPFGGPTACP